MVPVVFAWRDVVLEGGEALRVMVPATRYEKIAARQFDDGEEYPLVVLEARSRNSHNQFFAALKDGFDNLPEDLAMIRNRLGIKTVPPEGWLNPEHLRKWALCETGWCEIAEFDFDNKDDAMKLCRWYRARDIYAQITLRGTHVTIKIANSQSAAAMAKQPFEESKRDVLNLIESMTGLRKGALMKHAGRSA